MEATLTKEARQRATKHAPPRREPRALTTADALAAALSELGVKSAFGIGGGGIAPFVDALEQSPIRTVHFRHECGAAFGALEAYHATGAPVVIFTTFGPGILNSLNGLAAAKCEQGKVILVSSMTAPANRGRSAVQESTAETLGGLGLLSAGPLFDFTAAVEDASQWPGVLHGLARGLAEDGSFVAHVAVSASLFASSTRPLATPRVRRVHHGVDRRAVREAAEALSNGSFAIWVGPGARGDAAAVRRLAEETIAPVLATPGGKGVMPEDSVLYLGVSGLGGHASAREYLRAYRPDRMLVLGARVGELDSFWSSDYAPREAFVEVGRGPAKAGAAYPETACLSIDASIGEFLDQLRPLLGAGAARLPLPARPFPRAETPEPERRVRPGLVLQALQKEVVDATDAIVLSDAGASLSWANQLLRFDKPRYRTSTAWASMGHAASGVVGAALATGRKAVALAGDGAMLMNGEVNTAVTHAALAVWVILNDACYGMVEHCMRAQGFEGTASRMAATDFARMAEAQGALGIRVSSETELERAFRAAIAHTGPVVVDVVVDDTVPGPYLERAASLKSQGIVGHADAKEVLS